MTKKNIAELNGVSKLAFLCANGKLDTNIPYAHEIWNQLNNIFDLDFVTTDPMMQDNALWLTAESRYTLINELLIQSGITQVLELAAGWNPRGLTFAKQNNFGIYVDSDLGGIVDYKPQILSSTGHIPKNLIIRSVDATSASDFAAVSSLFDSTKPVAVISEGLMSYLTMEQKEAVARTIHGLLAKHGGIWLTNGIVPKVAGLDDSRKSWKNVNSITGVSREALKFETTEQLNHFMNCIGLSVKFFDSNLVRHKLSMPTIRNMTDTQVQAAFIKFPEVSKVARLELLNNPFTCEK
jgi:O-methyltransferase involved in polyketide biosynthesis